MAFPMPGPGVVQLWLYEPWQAAALAKGRGRRPASLAALALALGLEPEELRISRQGRPRIQQPVGAPHYSVSHSHGWMLLGLCMDEALGVDLELADPALDPAPVWQRHFSGAEARALQALGPEAGRREFYRQWTRKEALLKLTGLGIPALESLKHGAVPGWVEELALPEGLAGALAMARPPCEVRLSAFPGMLQERYLEVA